MQTERLLSEAFIESHPEEAARILERFSPKELAQLFRDLAPGRAAAVLERLEVHQAVRCLAFLSPEETGALISPLALHVSARLLRRMEPQRQEALLASLPSETSSPLRLLLQYPEGTAGTYMDPLVLSLSADLSVGDALRRIRRSSQHLIYYLYIVDQAHVLKGVISLRELMLARHKAQLQSVMHAPVVRLSARADRATIVHHPGWQRFHKMPVVDDRGVLVGVMRYKTLRWLEGRQESPGWGQGALALSLGLGEVYWLGLSAAVQGLKAVFEALEQTGNHRKEASHAP